MNPKSKLFESIVNKARALKKTLIMVIIPLALLSLAVTVTNYKKASRSIEVQPNSTITTLINSSGARAFINQKIDPATIDLIIKCGTKAPGAQNQQPWHLSVIENRKIIKTIAAAATDSANAANPSAPKERLFSNAPVVIIIAATAHSQQASFEAALACENMSIAAQSLGLGTRIVTAMPFLNGPKAQEYQRLLKIPRAKKPIAALLIGIPDYSSETTTSHTASQNLKGISRLK